MKERLVAEGVYRVRVRVRMMQGSTLTLTLTLYTPSLPSLELIVNFLSE